MAEFCKNPVSGPVSGSGSEREPRPCDGCVGVLGGTFDPVHNGHVALAKAALEQGNLSRLIVMPAEVQPFKRGKETAEDRHRLNMVRLAFEDMPFVEVSDYEMKNTDISYTYDTLTYLQGQYPCEEIAFIMGTDAFLEVDTWYKGVELLETFSFLVSVRPGYRESELEEKIEHFQQLYGTKVEKLVMEMPDISSTAVRSFCSAGISLVEKVPEKVERYICEHGLYKQLYRKELFGEEKDPYRGREKDGDQSGEKVRG